ncbi:hypothetical protein Tco_1482088, partial [Tanacetum coccineum]
QLNPSSFTCRKSSTERNVRPQSVADRAASSNGGPFVGQSGEGTSSVHNEELISKLRCNVIEESGYTICHVVCFGSSDLDAATRPLNAHGHLQFF